MEFQDQGVAELSLKANALLATYVYNERTHTCREHYDNQSIICSLCSIYSSFDDHVLFLDNDNRQNSKLGRYVGSQLSRIAARNYSAANNSNIAAYTHGFENNYASTSVSCWQGQVNKF